MAMMCQSIATGIAILLLLTCSRSTHGNNKDSLLKTSDSKGENCEAVVVVADGTVANADEACQQASEDDWCDDCDWDDLTEELCQGEKRPKPVPSLEDYMIMRRAYIEMLGEERSTISPLAERDGFTVPHRAGQAGHKGRGVFATEFIPKGTQVLNGRQEAAFYDGASVRKFLSLIPQASACDFLSWAYPEWNDNDEAEIHVDLDDAALLNNGRGQGNLGCDPEAAKEYKGGCDVHRFATRDIQPGEEMLLRYADFSAGEDGYEELGL